MPDDTREHGPHPTKRGRSRARRVLGVIGSVVGATVTFVVGTAAATVIHLDRPATRRVVATQGTAILGGLFKGSIQIQRVGSLTLSGLSGVKGRILDPEGVEVLAVDGVRVRISAIQAARSALLGKGPIRIDVGFARIDHVDVNLDGDAQGELRIANAFLPKNPEPSVSEEPPGRGVIVEVPAVELGHAWAHGTPPGAILVDAELRDLAARAHVDPKVIHVDLDRVGLVARALPRGANPQGKINGTFTMPAASGKGMEVSAIFDGDVGEMPTRIDARMNDDRIDAFVDTRDETGAKVRALAPEVAIQDAVTAHAEAHGVLPKIDGVAKITLGKATVDATASVDTSTSLQVAAKVAARHVDVSRIAEGAPASDLGLDLDGHVAMLNGVTGEVTIETLRGMVAGQPIPAATIQGSFAGKSAKVRASIHDPSMPTQVTVDLAPRADGREGQSIAATVKSHIPDLHRVPVIGATVSGGVDVDARANVVLPEKTLAVEADITASNVKLDQLSVRSARVRAKVIGSADAPIVDADVHAANLVTGAFPIATVDASARVEPVGKVITVRNAHVGAVRLGNPKITADARLVRIDGANLRVEEARVLGLGDPIRADVTKVGAGIDAKVDAPRIDLPLVARLAGQESLDLRKGTLGLRVDGELRANGEAKGTVHAELRDVSMRQVQGAKADIDVALDGRTIGLDVKADVGSTGNLELHTDSVVIGGPASNPASWKKAHGRVALASQIDLAKVVALLPPDTVPLGELRGVVVVQGRIGRDHATSLPEIQLHAHTLGLAAAGKVEPQAALGKTQVVDAPRWRISGTDVGVDVRNDATSGFTGVSFRITDGHGMLAAFDAKTTLPYESLVDKPEHARAIAMSAPMSARLFVPPRRLADLPPVLGTREIEGAIEADISATGTVLDPRLLVAARGRGVRTGEMPADVKADADVAFEYDGKAANLAVQMRSQGKDLLDVAAHLDANIKDLLEGKDAPWEASGKVKLAAFPLETIPQIAERSVHGRISGEVSLDGLHRDAKVKGTLNLEKLAIGRAGYEKGTISLDAGDGKMAAKVRLDQTDGFLEAGASTGLAWGKEIAPSLDQQQPVVATLKAHAFRAAAIQPFIESTVPSIDGRIEADASAKIVPGRPGAELRGTVAFSEGAIQTTVLGDELRNVRAKVALSPDGSIKVSDVYARGSSGEISADAAVKLDGFRLADATANIRIPDRKPLAAAVNGMPIGYVSGVIKVKASQTEDLKTTSLGVEVVKLAVELPQVMKMGVVQLEDRENIHIGTYRGRETFVKLPLDRQDTLPPPPPKEEDPSRVDIDVRLGRVVVTRGNTARVGLTGNLKVSSGAQLTMVGKIRTTDGWADVQGKKFEVEKAEVTFNGESPPNPVVNATAGWTASDGSRIYADFVGPVSTGKVTLRSEPARPRNEILATILFGTPDGANPQPATTTKSGSGPKTATKTATSLGGGYAAQGLTDALDDLAGIQATARIDSTSNNNPKPEIELQISQTVSIAFARVLGNPPITEPDRTFASVDYRFHRNWSLETTFGDKGKALFDAVWQKRY